MLVMSGLLVSWRALLLVADWVTNAMGWNSCPGRNGLVATGDSEVRAATREVRRDRLEGGQLGFGYVS